MGKKDKQIDDIGTALEEDLENTAAELERQKEEDAKSLQEVKDALKDAFESSRNNVVSSIKLGLALLKARKLLKGRFYNVINKDIIHKRQCQRYIKLVITVDSYQYLKNSMKDVDIDSLTVDENIESISTTPESIENMRFCSQKKLILMKEKMSYEEIKDCLAGDDAKYNEIIFKEKTPDTGGAGDGGTGDGGGTGDPDEIGDEFKEEAEQLSDYVGKRKIKQYTTAQPKTMMREIANVYKKVDKEIDKLKKMQEKYDSLKSKNETLKEENADLKKQIENLKEKQKTDDSDETQMKKAS